MMGSHGGGIGPLGWLALGVFWLILLGLITWLVVRLLPDRGVGASRTPGETALEILDRRLASGEIDPDVWQAHRAALLAAQSERR
jgi:putative membrane protein